MMSYIITFTLFLAIIAVLILAMIAPLWAFKLYGSFTFAAFAAVPFIFGIGLSLEMLDDIR
jgi:hypothetical protein